ncbi:PH domain-containing protein [Actinophytocola sp.]|uniref:PH domain-containing protein n=1 Tax=Actinophytocola sp. TaxID=1872138 RepID=UPI0025C3E7C3|nr:PH domain-containing protein [Actinophytocola sp.]
MTTQQLPRRLVFRTPATAVLGALLLVVTATPFAFAAPWLFLVYLVPFGAIALVLRLRTVADADGLVARTAFGRHELRWSDIRALRVSERSWVRAVLDDGKEQPLPTVRARHLPALALISGGRLDDPSEAPPPAEPVETADPVELDAKVEHAVDQD